MRFAFKSADDLESISICYESLQERLSPVQHDIILECAAAITYECSVIKIQMAMHVLCMLNMSQTTACLLVSSGLDYANSLFVDFFDRKSLQCLQRSLARSAQHVIPCILYNV